MIDSTFVLIYDGQIKIFLPSIEQRDFCEAKRLIPDLHRWIDCDDYLNEIEGYHFGLNSAGLDAQLVPISLHGFISWTRHASLPPTWPNLTEFARIVAIGRDNSRKNFEISFETGNDTKALVHLQSGSDETTVAVSCDLYNNWRQLAASLQSEGRTSTAVIYFRLLLDSWIEAP